MNAPEFADAYPRTLPDRLLHPPVNGVDLSGSRQWSNYFGEVLHDALSGCTIDGDAFTDSLEAYSGWLTVNFSRVQHTAHSTSDPEHLEAANELNFHILNATLLPAYMALTEDDASWPEQRRQLLRYAQDSLALCGLQYYVSREEVAGATSNYEYFSESNAAHRGSFEGRANEFDAAIVLLEMMRRRKELVVFAGPLQFEKYSHRSPGHSSSANSDFIAVQGNQAVGLQLKSRVRQSDKEHYDPSRVILVDAATDLGNERAMRTRNESSNRKTVIWGGLICAQRVTEIRTVGKQHITNQLDHNDLMRRKFRARMLTGGIKPHLQLAATRLLQRIDAHFEAYAT